MSVVNNYDKPDLFITMACNPNWEKITENIEEYGNTLGRPDIVAIVFNRKVQGFKDGVVRREALGISNFALPILTLSNLKNGDSHIYA